MCVNLGMIVNRGMELFNTFVDVKTREQCIPIHFLHGFYNVCVITFGKIIRLFKTTTTKIKRRANLEETSNVMHVQPEKILLMVNRFHQCRRCEEKVQGVAFVLVLSVHLVEIEV